MQYWFRQTYGSFSERTGNAIGLPGRKGRFRVVRLFLILGLWLPSGIQAQSADDIRLSLQEALYYCLKGNQDIRISSFLPQQAEEDLNEAKSVYAPALILAGSHERLPDIESDFDSPTIDDSSDFRAGIKMLLSTGGNLSLFWESQLLNKVNDPFNFKSRYAARPTVELRQPLLENFGSKAEKTAIRVRKNNVNISEAEFQQKVLDVVAQVSRIYWQLYLQREILDINRETLELAEEVHRRETVRLDEGISRPLDVARARSKAEGRRAEIIRSRESVRIVTEQLKFLINWTDLNLDSDKGILAVETPRIEPIRVSLQEAIHTGLRNRPEIIKARESEEIAGNLEKLALHRQLPNLDLVMSYSTTGLGGGFWDAFGNMSAVNRNDWNIGLELEVPIGNESAKAVHRKQQLVSRQTVIQRERIENQIKLEIKEVLFGIDQAAEEIESSRLETEAAEEVVEGEMERFELGRMTNEELLRAQDFLASAQRKYAQAVVKYNIAISELDRARSTLPPGLEIESAKNEGSR